MPRAEFWRIWGLAALLAALLIGLFLVNAPAAHAEGGHRHRVVHHGHRATEHHHRRLHGVAHHRRAAASYTRSGDAVSIAMRYLGAGNPTGTHRAWCGDFVNMTERLSGRPGLAAGGLASAWRFYGHASAPVRGAIAVMRGHVSRVVQRMGNRVLLISGNWSHRVSIHVAPLRAVLAFRML